MLRQGLFTILATTFIDIDLFERNRMMKSIHLFPGLVASAVLLLSARARHARNDDARCPRNGGTRNGGPPSGGPCRNSSAGS